MARNYEAEVTREDLINIKVGTSVTFSVSHPRILKSIRSIASDINNSEPELKKRLRCSRVAGESKMIVSAEPIKRNL